MAATRAATVAASLFRAAQLDRAWIGKAGDSDRRYTPWMPFPMHAFISMLAEAVTAVAEYGTPDHGDDIRLLEIGCGPGPKLLVARDLFGLDALGFDRSAEYVAAARSIGLNADEADAEHYTAYSWPHITWFNRVARDADIQARIEARVWRDTRPGGIVMGANLEAPPPSSWLPVLDDWADLRRGIWRKPDGPPPGW